jgi:hypothetical protein
LRAFDEKRKRKMEIVLFSDPGMCIEGFQLCEDCASQFLKGGTDQKAVLAAMHTHLYPPRGTMQ